MGLENIDEVWTLFQTWKTKDVPEKWQESINSRIAVMPDIKHEHMTDDDNENFIRKYYPEFYSAYINFEYGIKKADFIRYAVLHHDDMMVYSDYDHKFNEDFRPYLTGGDLFFLPSANKNTNCYTNAFMASRKKGNPIFYEMMKEAVKPAPWWCVTMELDVMYTTGPKMITRILNSGKYNFVTLSYLDFQPYSVCDKVYDKKSVITPLEGSSWVSESRKEFYHECYCFYQDYTPLFWIIIFALIVMFLFIFYILFL
jgi:mannosyltransferase OCH1-like enzyme